MSECSWETGIHREGWFPSFFLLSYESSVSVNRNLYRNTKQNTEHYQISSLWPMKVGN